MGEAEADPEEDDGTVAAAVAAVVEGGAEGEVDIVIVGRDAHLINAIWLYTTVPSMGRRGSGEQRHRRHTAVQ